MISVFFYHENFGYQFHEYITEDLYRCTSLFLIAKICGVWYNVKNMFYFNQTLVGVIMAKYTFKYWFEWVIVFHGIEYAAK